MEAQKIINLLDNTENEYSNFATKNGILSTVNLKAIIHIRIQ